MPDISERAPVPAHAGTGGASAPENAADTERSATSGQPLLRLRGVIKSFGPVRALNGVDLDVPAGQVTALVGDNGAGKSTLIKTISGIHPADGGEIAWAGKAVHIGSPKDSTALGIATVYQDLALCDNLDIVQNMFLGHEVVERGVLSEGAMETTARKTLSELSVTTVRSIRQPVGSLSGGQRQAVAVARAVMGQARLVILDEPTAALGVSQTAMVLDLIRTLSQSGIAVLFVSHNLNDVFAVSDRIAVLHLGTMATSGPIADFDVSSVVQLITTGRRSEDTTQSSRSMPSPAPHHAQEA